VREAARSLEQPKEFERNVEPITQQAIGSDLFLRWLRVSQVGSLHLVRYSLWVELLNKAEFINARLRGRRSNEIPAESLEELVQAYVEAIRELSSEVFRRRPFSKEPIKIVWEEGAKVLNAIGSHAVVEPAGPGRDAFLKAFSVLGETLGGLCNQWVGYEQSMESAVLVHSFNALMDWPSIVLLSDRGSDSQKVVRSLVLDEWIGRRLFFDDPLVPLETLRVINASMERAIDRANRENLVAFEQPNLDFFDLIELIGSFAKKNEVRLGAHHPLFTELARFFALALLWLPDGFSALGITVSDSGLAEFPRHIAWFSRKPGSFAANSRPSSVFRTRPRLTAGSSAIRPIWRTKRSTTTQLRAQTGGQIASSELPECGSCAQPSFSRTSMDRMRPSPSC
jgi:hypothetical protein